MKRLGIARNKKKATQADRDRVARGEVGPLRRESYHGRGCSCCGQTMYYDGRCGDGPICMNNNCRTNIEAAYWANDRR